MILRCMVKVSSDYNQQGKSNCCFSMLYNFPNMTEFQVARNTNLVSNCVPRCSTELDALSRHLIWVFGVHLQLTIDVISRLQITVLMTLQIQMWFAQCISDTFLCIATQFYAPAACVRQCAKHVATAANTDSQRQNHLLITSIHCIWVLRWATDGSV